MRAAQGPAKSLPAWLTATIAGGVQQKLLEGGACWVFESIAAGPITRLRRDSLY